MATTEGFILSNKKSWDEVAPRFFGRTALPSYGPFAPDEDKLNLLGDISGAKVLEIGCGSGHSLQYMASRGAEELWGLDLSDIQIATAKTLLEPYMAILKQLFQSPMEQDPGLPRSYFEIVYSIYAIGWTVDLPTTLQNVYGYLKPGGIFVFSWEHPLHNRIKFEGDSFVVKKSYHEEGLHQCEAWNDRTAIVNQLKLSNYINELVRTGFQIERVVEDVYVPENAEIGNPSRWYSSEKAELIPATFIIKCVKPKK
ncbi:class I SAM-dependent methyltransferase [Alicyclobacillus sp. ALC3]|uniref:class I SAM-dependent methyltransferase n=1 Tax=Alicyclobacillus sp. ALC3 TaxID=2796143 RepID=UPI0023799E00|nr:class I SAM-dependent methyltransferase [Alicyclobacillus sp. ALC3]WDL97885.1 methyltransferase domain-containing protein [Alicyclobacillus sp. ALC3]